MMGFSECGRRREATISFSFLNSPLVRERFLSICFSESTTKAFNNTIVSWKPQTVKDKSPLNVAALCIALAQEFVQLSWEQNQRHDTGQNKGVVSQSSSEADQVSKHFPVWWHICTGTSKGATTGATGAYTSFKHLQNCGENRVSQTSQSEKSICTLMAKATCFGHQYII